MCCALHTADVNNTTFLSLHVSSSANISHYIICTQFRCSCLRSAAVFPGGRAPHTVRAGLMRHLPNGLVNEERSGRKNESSLVKSSVLGTVSLRAAEQCRGSLQRSVSLLKSSPPEPVSSLRCLFPNLPTLPSLIALCFCESLFV